VVLAGAEGDSSRVSLLLVYVLGTTSVGGTFQVGAEEGSCLLFSCASGCEPSISQEAGARIKQGGESSFNSCSLRGTCRTQGNSSFLG